MIPDSAEKFWLQGKLKVFLVVEKKIIGMIIDAVEYRNSVKSLARGSTYFMS